VIAEFQFVPFPASGTSYSSDAVVRPMSVVSES
jgi:hypothetical protein